MTRLGLISAAHVHAWSYVHAGQALPAAELVGVWDDQPERGRACAEAAGVPFVGELDALLDQVDAVVVASENLRHGGHLERAAAAGLPVLCEKPLAASWEELARIEALEANGARIMTAFPCRYAPAFLRLMQRVANGDIGPIRAVCATNRGRCPFSWFVEPSQSGGGAMIDHVVHVADLLAVLLGGVPQRIDAHSGSNLYGKDWDDTAMLTLDYPGGIFATLDSSWSRPQNYKTWGDVTMNVVGELGVIEIDLFGQAFEWTGEKGVALAGYGSDLDRLMLADFVRYVRGEIDNPVPVSAGLAASKVALGAMESARSMGPISVA